MCSINLNLRASILSFMNRIVQCTRWKELSEALKFHAQLAEIAGTPTEFRLLNGADPCVVGLKDDNGEALKFVTESFEDVPLGQTPLCEHISKVVLEIESIAPELRSRNQKAAVIIVTDGLATDGDVIEALRPFQFVS